MAVATDRSARELTSEPGPSGSRWVKPAAIVVLLTLVSVLVAVGWFGVQAAQGFAAERARDNAVDAARTVAVNLTTLSAETAERDTARLLDSMTPTYAAGLEGDSGKVVTKLAEGQVSTSGTVTEAGMISYDPATETAKVLVTVRAQVRNAAAPQGVTRDYRIVLTMVDQGDWLADDVEFRS